MRLLLLLLLLPTAVLAQPPLAPLKATALNARTASADTVYVINFWATWCPPCVAELPEFETLQDQYDGKPVKILLVSLDFKEDVRFKVPAFVQRKRLRPEVVWLDETDANAFIPKIEPRWTGSIPATLILDNRHKKRAFLERSITAAELAAIITPMLNSPR